MEHIKNMVSMRNTPKEDKESEVGIPCLAKEEYPWGLQVTLNTEQLKKLDLPNDCEVGDMIHMFSMCKIISKSSRTKLDGERDDCITLQITDISVEDEDEENEEEDQQDPIEDYVHKTIKQRGYDQEDYWK